MLRDKDVNNQRINQNNIKILKPVMFFTFLFGTLPFNLIKNDYKVKISVIGLTFCCIQFLISLKIAVREVYKIFHNRSIVLVYVSIIITITAICNILIISILILRLKEIGTVLNDILKLLSNIDKNYIRKSFLISHTVTFFFMLYILIIINYNNALGMILVQSLPFQWMNFSPFTTDCLIIIVTTILTRKYKEINNSIEKIYKESTSDTKLVSVLINNIILKHWYIGNIVLKLSSYFGPHLLLSNINILFSITLGLSKSYYIYTIPNTQWNTNVLILNTIMESMLLFARIVIVSERCDSVTYQSKRTCLHLQKLMKDNYIYLENDVFEHVCKFQMQVDKRPIDITACGFYKINASFAGKMASTVLTYLVFMVQFQGKKNS